MGEQAGRRDAQRAASCATSTSDAGAQGLAAYIDIDRDTAARLGVTASAIDDALYSAFGQRIVSTIFTETNQYRVILEAQPGLLGTRRVARQAQPAHRARASRRRSTAIATHHASGRRRCRSRTSRSTRRRRSASTPRPASRSAPRSTRSATAAKAIGLPQSVQLTFLGASGAYERSLVEPALADPGGGDLRLHRARRALRELRPPADDPVDAALGRRRRAARAADHAATTWA